MKTKILSLIFIVVILVWWVRREEVFFPIHYVRIEGSIKNIDDQKFHEALSPSVNGGYFSLDLEKIETVAKQFAWLDTIKITRYWPDTLVLSISEHKPIARWGEHALLNQRGERFEPESLDGYAHLPLVHGPLGTEIYLLGMVKMLNDRLNGKNMRVASLELNERRSWVANLSGGMELYFGRQDPLNAMDRFLEFVPKLGEEKLARLKRVDLRYPNGFAVIWQPLDANKAEKPEVGAIEFNMKGKASQLALEM